MYAYTYINACDAIGPAIHKNGLFYGREADYTRAVHEYECFYGREIMSRSKWSRATAFRSASRAHRPAPQPENSRWSKPIVLRSGSRAHRPAPSCPEEKRSHRQSSCPPETANRARNKRTNENSGVYCISAEATTFATLARRAATLPLSAGWTRWVRSITAQRASRSMTIEVPV